MKSNVVFSIREGMVKFLQVSGTQKKLVAATAVFNTSNQSDAQISQRLNAFVKMQKLNFAESRVTVMVPRSSVILRHMVFPSQSKEEIRSMIDLQVGNRIPFAREEVEIDFQVLTKSADGYAKVAVVIIPQDIAMRYCRIFSDARIPVHGITISSIGLWLFNLQQPDLSEKNGAIFDLDVNHSEICLFTKTHWLASREIPMGLAQIGQEGYAGILKQWELTQHNAGGEKLAGPVELVYVTSTAEQARALGVEMAKAQDNLTVKEIDLTRSLGLGPGVQWPKAMTNDGVSLAALAGIACSSETPPINLIPTVVQQTQQKRIYQRQLLMVGLWVAAALISLGLALGMGYIKKNIQLARLEDQLRDTKQNSITVEDQLQKIHDIEGMIKGRLIFADLAREIYRLLPSQIYLVSITISDGNTLSFQGVSSSTVDINQFQKSMADSKSFSNVNLDYVNKRVTQEGEVDYFKIRCTVNTRNGPK